MTVAQAFQASRRAVNVFIAFKTDCVGCPLIRFCTLQEMVDSHQLPLQDLLTALEEATRSNSIAAADIESQNMKGDKPIP
ncbi:MAG: hypothetical protein Fur0043_01860 [Anaerolineales bacterium]